MSVKKPKKKILEDFDVGIQKDRDIGIEIEMEGVGLLQGPDGWNTTRDGSLRGESCEWVLRRPVKEKDVPIYLDRLQDHLAAGGSRLQPSDRCGVHIHVNCQELTTEEVVQFCLLYLALEDILVGWCGEDREGNLFCLRAQDAEYIISALVQARHSGHFKKVARQDIRYASLNLTALSKYGSLEFRALRSPSDFDIIKTWVKLLMDIKRASSSFKSPEEIVEAISALGSREFLTKIFGDRAVMFRRMPGLNHIMLDAARRVQDIAYALKFKPKKKEGVEGLPWTYWDNMKSIKRWTREGQHTFIKYDPYLDLLSYIPRRQVEEVTTAWVGVAVDVDDYPDESSITYTHQRDDVYINRMWNILSSEGGGIWRDEMEGDDDDYDPRSEEEEP